MAFGIQESYFGESDGRKSSKIPLPDDKLAFLEFGSFKVQLLVEFGPAKIEVKREIVVAHRTALAASRTRRSRFSLP